MVKCTPAGMRATMRLRLAVLGDALAARSVPSSVGAW